MRHQIWKKGTALTAAFALAVVPALAGCGSEQKEKAADSGKSGEQDKEKKEMAMGRYLEEDVTLPEGCGDIADMTMLEDGSLRVCYIRSGEGAFYTDSSDGGKTWGETKNLAELLGIDPEKYTVSRAMLNFTGEHSTDMGPQFAFIVMAMIPTLLIYLIFHEKVESGILSGAVKG